VALHAESAVPTIELKGLHFAKLTREQVVDHVFRALARGSGGWIATLTLDYLRRCAADPGSRKLLSGTNLAVADGMPLLWAARLLGTPFPDRVAGSDLVWLLAERAAREGRSLYLLGGNPGAADGARALLRARWPNLRIAGVSSPRISAEPSQAEISSLRALLDGARSDLVYVALGSPKQDRVIAALRPHFPGTWWIGVGVSLSFMAGEIRRAPQWMQRAGLEWMHRLVQEPRRLAHRYLVQDLPFAVRLLAGAWLDRRRAAPSGAQQTRPLDDDSAGCGDPPEAEE
jgi:N-acetylglucosaminyldiphosphoundecaprenol N-acetyl-beta-D-mannosaminyltransferase